MEKKRDATKGRMIKYKTKKEIELLFSNLSIRLISINESIYPELKECNLRKSTYYINNYEEFNNLEKKYGEQLKNYYHAPLYVKKTDDEIGYGLFADKSLIKGDLIGQYTGIVQEASAYDDSNEDISAGTEFAWDYPDEIPGLPPLEINAGNAGSILRFANHSFMPNLRVEHAVIGNEWMIFFIADMNIDADTQLFCDYGDDYWSVDFREVVIP
jgi:hypothetical protein